MTPAIEVTDVSCRLGRVQALDRLSLRVDESAVQGVVGPNGAGKTTLIDVVCGLLRPQSGAVRVLGLSYRDDPLAVRRRIGLVPQETALYDEASAWQNLRLAADLYGVRHARSRIGELLDLVGLASRARDRVGTFSGGMRRRLAIARALVHDPAVLVLDEPTLGVDIDARHQIWEHLRGLRAHGRTVLLATNYLDEAEALCDRVALLREGRLLGEDTPRALVAKAGRCLDIECAPDQVERLRIAFAERREVLRVEPSQAGVVMYLDQRWPPEQVARQAMQVASLIGFRVRSPDLSEVFRAMAGDHAV